MYLLFSPRYKTTKNSTRISPSISSQFSYTSSRTETDFRAYNTTIGTTTKKTFPLSFKIIRGCILRSSNRHEIPQCTRNFVSFTLPSFASFLSVRLVKPVQFVHVPKHLSRYYKTFPGRLIRDGRWLAKSIVR